LADAKRSGWFVELDEPVRIYRGARNRDGLPLSAGKSADGRDQINQLDAKLGNVLLRLLI